MTCGEKNGGTRKRKKVVIKRTTRKNTISLDDRSKPIKNYKGMWKPLPKPLSKMKRDELIKHLQKFRDAWEKITTRNQDLDNERLKSESISNLRSLLQYYYSNDAKLLAEDWLKK